MHKFVDFHEWNTMCNFSAQKNEIHISRGAAELSSLFPTLASHYNPEKDYCPISINFGNLFWLLHSPNLAESQHLILKFMCFAKLYKARNIL